MALFWGQLKKSQKLTNLTRMIAELLEIDSTIILESIYAKRVIKIDQIFEKLEEFLKKRKNGHFSIVC